MGFLYTTPLACKIIKKIERGREREREREKETTEETGKRGEESVEGTCHVTATTTLQDSAMLRKKRNSPKEPATNTRLCLSISLYTKARVGRCAGH